MLLSNHEYVLCTVNSMNLLYQSEKENNILDLDYCFKCLRTSTLLSDDKDKTQHEINKQMVRNLNIHHHSSIQSEDGNCTTKSKEHKT